MKSSETADGTFGDRRYYREKYEESGDVWTEMEQLDERTTAWLHKYEADFPQPLSVLDLGCGRGRITSIFARNNFYAVGLDYLADPIPGTDRKQLDFVIADALRLPFCRRSFSAVVDYGCLHHVRKRDWEDYRHQVNRALKPGGLYFFSVFHVDDGHADRGNRKWISHRGHYDRFFEAPDLPRLLGEDQYVYLEKGLVEIDGHVFLHGLLKRSASATE